MHSERGFCWGAYMNAENQMGPKENLSLNILAHMWDNAKVVVQWKVPLHCLMIKAWCGILVYHFNHLFQPWFFNFILHEWMCGLFKVQRPETDLRDMSMLAPYFVCTRSETWHDVSSSFPYFSAYLSLISLTLLLWSNASHKDSVTPKSLCYMCPWKHLLS